MPFVLKDSRNHGGRGKFPASSAGARKESRGPTSCSTINGDDLEHVAGVLIPFQRLLLEIKVNTFVPTGDENNNKNERKRGFGRPSDVSQPDEQRQSG